MFSSVQAINRQSKADYAEAAATLGGAPVVDLVHRDGADIPLATYIALRRAGWSVSPELEIRRRIAGRVLTFRGVDPFTTPPALLPPAMARTIETAPGSLLLDAVLFAAPETLDALAEIGPALPDATLPRGQVVADISAVAALAETPDRLTRLILAPEQRSGPSSARRAGPRPAPHRAAGRGGHHAAHR